MVVAVPGLSAGPGEREGSEPRVSPSRERRWAPAVAITAGQRARRGTFRELDLACRKKPGRVLELSAGLGLRVLKRSTTESRVGA